jgi:hypothetical protein
MTSRMNQQDNICALQFRPELVGGHSERRYDTSAARWSNGVGRHRPHVRHLQDKQKRAEMTGLTNPVYRAIAATRNKN